MSSAINPLPSAYKHPADVASHAQGQVVPGKLKAARGLVVGVVIASVFWAAVAAVAATIWL